MQKHEEKIREISEGTSESAKKLENQTKTLKSDLDKKNYLLEESRRNFEELQARLTTILSDFENYKKDSDKKRTAAQATAQSEIQELNEKIKKLDIQISSQKQKLLDKEEEIKDKVENLSVARRTANDNMNEMREKLKAAEEALKITDGQLEEMKKYVEFQASKVKKVEDENEEWRKLNEEKNEIIQKFDELSKRNQEERKILHDNISNKEITLKKIQDKQGKKPASKPSEIKEDKATNKLEPPKNEDFSKISEKVYIQRIKELESEIMQERLKSSKEKKGAEENVKPDYDFFNLNGVLSTKFSDEVIIKSNFPKGQKLTEIIIKKVGLWINTNKVYGIKITYFHVPTGKLIEGGSHIAIIHKDKQKYFEFDSDVINSLKCTYDDNGKLLEITAGLSSGSDREKLLFQSSAAEGFNVDFYKLKGEQYIAGELAFNEGKNNKILVSPNKKTNIYIYKAIRINVLIYILILKYVKI